MSLWKVDDETTRVLMEAYYRSLLAGQGRATAMHEAMREVRLAQPHPHYWAPFIVMGRNTPLRLLASSSQHLGHLAGSAAGHPRTPPPALTGRFGPPG
jgi:hypothetical protein